MLLLLLGQARSVKYAKCGHFLCSLLLCKNALGNPEFFSKEDSIPRNSISRDLSLNFTENFHYICLHTMYLYLVVARQESKQVLKLSLF